MAVAGRQRKPLAINGIWALSPATSALQIAMLRQHLPHKCTSRRTNMAPEGCSVFGRSVFRVDRRECSVIVTADSHVVGVERVTQGFTVQSLRLGLLKHSVLRRSSRAPQ